MLRGKLIKGCVSIAPPSRLICQKDSFLIERQLNPDEVLPVDTGGLVALTDTFNSIFNKRGASRRLCLAAKDYFLLNSLAQRTFGFSHSHFLDERVGC
jgi:hypothetical protein